MGLACSSSKPLLQLLVVPGNPGFCGFYDEFMLQLAQLFGRHNVDIMAVSHAGHDSAGLSQGKVWCLDSQIQHKVALLKEHVLAPGRPPAVILAHSIGSYIMLQAVKQLEQEMQAAGTHLQQQLPKVVLLMPFMATDWSSSRQRVLRFAASLAPLLGAVAGAVGRLPGWLQDRLVALVQPGVEPHARGSMKALMTAGGVHNNFHLARHEFRDLDRPADFGLIRRLGRRAAVVCAPDDMWFPQQHYQQMRSALPGIEEYWSDKLTHAFCLESHQCKHVAELVYASVTSSMPHLAARTAQGLRPNSGDLAAAAAEMLAEGARDTQQQQLDQAEVGAVDMSILVSEEAAGGQAAKAKVAC
uniref:AB hydrolase-1 domain-containing protein n=1 Tax=Tetradesmus obliquus TaxID=3088 RepID=A0A383V4Q4_TETOB|eukprot:jgi/Sobl393_1/9194/SZX60585.1